MAKGFKHGAGGGASLNFKVVGGTSAPSNPKANTIWVNTDKEIAGWHFGTEEPNVCSLKNPNPNDPWWMQSKCKLSVGDVLNFIIPMGATSQFEALRIHDPYAHKYYYVRSYGSGLAGSAWPAGTKVGVVISNDRHPIGGWGGTDDSGSAYITAWDSYYHEEGTVWISTGTSSTAPFNALKKNNITVYPMSAKQYVNGAWVNKTAKTYQGGKWVDWIVYVVPSNTFSWFSNNTVRGNVTKNNDNSVTVKCTSTNYYVMGFTNESFDLTGFNKMIVTYTSTSGYTMAAIGVATSTTGTEAYNEYIAYTKVNKTSTPVTATINISNINRPVYFGATEFNGSITIYEIRLEV